jgi:hypothetical protein
VAVELLTTEPGDLDQMGTFLLVVMTFGEVVVYNRGIFGRKKGSQGARVQGLPFGGGAADGDRKHLHTCFDPYNPPEAGSG